MTGARSESGEHRRLADFPRTGAGPEWRLGGSAKQSAPMGKSRRVPSVYVVTVIAALSGLLFGYDTGVISGAILFVRQKFHLGSVGTEVVTSAVVFGAIIGAALGGDAVDPPGAKARSIMAAAAVFTTRCRRDRRLAPSVVVMPLGRFIVGVNDRV